MRCSFDRLGRGFGHGDDVERGAGGGERASRAQRVFSFLQQQQQMHKPAFISEEMPSHFNSAVDDIKLGKSSPGSDIRTNFFQFLNFGEI